MFQRSKMLQELIFKLDDAISCQNTTVVLSKLAYKISELYREFGRLDFANAYYNEYEKFKEIEEKKRYIEFKLLSDKVRYEVEIYLQPRRAAPSTFYSLISYSLLSLSSVYMKRTYHEEFASIYDILRRLQPEAHQPQAKLILQGKLLAVKRQIEDQYKLDQPSSTAWQILTDLLKNHFSDHLNVIATHEYEKYCWNNHRIVSDEVDREKLLHDIHMGI